MDMNEAKFISHWNRDPAKAVWHPDTEDTMDALITEIERLETILYGRPMAAPAVLDALRESAHLAEAAASAELSQIDEGKCLYCAKQIPYGATRCPSCGWDGEYPITKAPKMGGDRKP